MRMLKHRACVSMNFTPGFCLFTTNCNVVNELMIWNKKKNSSKSIIKLMESFKSSGTFACRKTDFKICKTGYFFIIQIYPSSTTLHIRKTSFQLVVQVTGETLQPFLLQSAWTLNHFGQFIGWIHRWR